MPSGCFVSVRDAATDVAVPAALAPHVAHMIRVGVLAALTEQRETGERRIPAEPLLDLVRRLEALTASGHEGGQPAATLSTIDAAARLGVSESTIRRMCRTGRLPARRVGRDWQIEREGLIAWQTRR
jgi:excisionase family DNA binding protein